MYFIFGPFLPLYKRIGNKASKAGKLNIDLLIAQFISTIEKKDVLPMILL